MIRGLDSKPPTNAAIQQAHGSGQYGIWALYHGTPGDGIAPDHLASDDDFKRVLGGGLGTFAYVSGNEDPLAIKAWSQKTGIATCVDVERFIRSDGPWVQGWLDASGSGLYGNPPVHSGRRAAFHVVADYVGYDPKAAWPSWVARPASPCGWQFQGTTAMFGTEVDVSWFDDGLLGLFGGSAKPLTRKEYDDMALFHDPSNNFMFSVGPGGKRHIALPELEALIRLGQGASTDMADADLALIPDAVQPPIDLSAFKVTVADIADIRARVDKDLAP